MDDLDERCKQLLEEYDREVDGLYLRVSTWAERGESPSASEVTGLLEEIKALQLLIKRQIS